MRWKGTCEITSTTPDGRASVRPFVDDAKHWTLLHGLLDGRLQEGGHGRVTRVDGRGILRIESNATAVRTLA